MFLKHAEIIQLTGKRYCNAQVRALRSMGINHAVRPDGSVLVLRSHIEALLGPEGSKRDTIKSSQPDWNAIHG